ncbi:MAG: hypothetical protein ACI8RD_001044 [Bacillariaceae sp.]|jgi:hypothetical protein
MLSRKTSNLGRVVDGEKNAGMNAQKSGQDELQSFFAETSVRDEKVSKTPVKGSILSYFGKQQNQKNQPNKALGSKIEIEGDAKESSKARSSIATKGILKNSRKIEWDCVACTLHNSQEQQHSDWLVCEICQTPYTNMIDVDANDSDLKNRLHQVTPASARKGNSNSLGNSNVDTQSIRRYETETIVIDETEEKKNNDPVALKLDSSLENPIVLCDIPEETSYPRKKQKTIHHQLHSKLATKHKYPVSGGDRLKTKTVPLLSFSVSKNSGRITIHFYASGESTLTNFEVEQIVSKTTADHLMEAQLSRIKNAYVALVYDQAVLHRGMYLICRQY